MSDVSEEKSRDDKPVQDQPVETGQSDEPRLSPALIATLIAVPVMVIAGFIAFAALKYSGDEPAPSPVESYATGGPGAELCADFIEKLPAQLGEFNDKTIDDTTVRWRKADSDPIVLRCGVQRPADFAPTSSLQVINPIQWFLTDTVDGVGQAYVSVDHRPYIAMWLPAGAGNAPITDVSGLIAEHLKASPLDFGN